MPFPRLGAEGRESQMKLLVSLQPLVGTALQGSLTISCIGNQPKLGLPWCRVVPVIWQELG